MSGLFRDMFSAAVPPETIERTAVAYHIAAYAVSADEAVELAEMLGLDAVHMSDFAAADRWLTSSRQ